MIVECGGGVGMLLCEGLVFGCMVVGIGDLVMVLLYYFY